VGRTQTEEGLKWLKKQRRRSEVKENLVFGRKYQGRQIIEEYRSWTTQKEKEYTKGCYGAPR
jgi:hypothetical protein